MILSVRIGCVALLMRRSARRANVCRQSRRGGRNAAGARQGATQRAGVFCRRGFVERLARSPATRYALL
ncbi:MAG: hypothetical protein WAN51_10595, partial [Alphaproteobacteria bacterium]